MDDPDDAVVCFDFNFDQGTGDDLNWDWTRSIDAWAWFGHSVAIINDIKESSWY